MSEDTKVPKPGSKYEAVVLGRAIKQEIADKVAQNVEKLDRERGR
jgi:hypothetical protein